jgi:hypothetical protein
MISLHILTGKEQAITNLSQHRHTFQTMQNPRLQTVFRNWQHLMHLLEAPAFVLNQA